MRYNLEFSLVQFSVEMGFSGYSTNDARPRLVSASRDVISPTNARIFACLTDTLCIVIVDECVSRVKIRAFVGIIYILVQEVGNKKPPLSEWLFSSMHERINLFNNHTLNRFLISSFHLQQVNARCGVQAAQR